MIENNNLNSHIGSTSILPTQTSSLERIINNGQRPYARLCPQLQNELHFHFVVQLLTSTNQFIQKYPYLETSKRHFLEAVKLRPATLKDAHLEIQKDTDILKAASTDPKFPTYLDSSYKTDKSFAQKVVSLNGLALINLNPSLQLDIDVAVSALKKDSSIFAFLSPSVTNNRRVVLAAVKHDGMLLQSLNSKWRKDRAIALTAFIQNPKVFSLINQAFLSDETFTLQAIKGNFRTVEHVDSTLRQNPTFMLQAIVLKAWTYRHVDNNIKFQPAFIKNAVRANGNVLNYLNTKSITKELWMIAARQGIFIGKYPINVFDDIQKLF